MEAIVYISCTSLKSKLRLSAVSKGVQSWNVEVFWPRIKPPVTEEDIYLVRRFVVQYRSVVLRVVPYFGEPLGRVKIQTTRQILSDTTQQNV